MKKRFILSIVAMLALSGSMLAADNPALHPPKGSKVAIVVFEDMQCPSCGANEALIKQVEQSEQVALVRHDFPLPQHNWSMDAHVMARYFDTQSPEMGEEFRHYIFTNQRIINKTNLRSMEQQFASSHKTTLPLFVDPSGQLAAKVKADAAVGQAVGITQTPTVFVVGDVKSQPTYVRLDNIQNELLSAVQQMKSRVAAEEPKTKATSTHVTKKAK